MSLERSLAEIEVLVEDLSKRPRSDYFDVARSFDFNRALRGIGNDSQLVYSKCRETYGALKKSNFVLASSLFTEMALDLKNLADNLNVFMQVVYGDYEGDLRALESETRNAPRTSDGQTLAEVLSGTHGYSKDNLIKLARDSKGHGRGHAILFKTPNEDCYPKDKPYYVVFKDEKTLEVNLVYFSDDFISQQAEIYFEMTKKILQTISDGDAEHFKPRTSNLKLKYSIQKIKDFYRRHSRPVAIATTSGILVAGLVGGSLGTVAYQTHQKQKDLELDSKKFFQVLDWKYSLQKNFDNYEIYGAEASESDLLEKRKRILQSTLITHPYIAPNYDLSKVFGTNSNLFHNTLQSLEIDSKKLGILIDNYLVRVPMDQKAIPGKTSEFLDKRKSFLKHVAAFSASERGKVPSPASLDEINLLVSEEKFLLDLESEIVSFFPRLK